MNSEKLSCSLYTLGKIYMVEIGPSSLRISDNIVYYYYLKSESNGKSDIHSIKMILNIALV